ncbi:chemotaxis protein CheA [soil metagenome]
MAIDMSQFFQVFFEETEELLAEMEKLLLAIDLVAPDVEHLNAIFRAAHSIKGGAATFGITDLTEVTHVLETLLDKIRKGEMVLTAQHVDTFLAAKDILKMQLDGHRLHTPVNQEAVAEVRATLQTMADASAGSKPEITSGESSANTAEKSAKPGKAGKAGATASESEQGGVANRCFRVELPKLPRRDVTALSAELGLLGSLTKEVLADKRTVFILTTTNSVDDIVAICSFVTDSAKLKITEELPAASAASEPPVDPATASESNVAAATDDDGYGFFEPLESFSTVASPPVSPKSQEEEQGYGFFAPFVPLAIEEPAVPPKVDADVHALPIAEVSETSVPEPLAKQDKGAGVSSEKATPVKRDIEATVNAPESSSIRVGIEKVDQLINLVGELVITQAIIEQRTSALDPILHERLMNSVSQLSRNTRDLQEAVMSIRMMPMDYVFSRFPRMVRDLAAKLGKRVDIITHGAATELDKSLIERIVDPLTHLIRNSVDHGIETPEVRAAAGKSETGKLSLVAGHQGGNVIIEVSDDGAGLNCDRILAKARQQGIPLPEGMTEEEIWQLIFAPGFSTAETVTDISGRGVGMDVVKRNITAMGGVVDIRSALGFGTTIAISLPLTLAILDGMSIRVGDEIYILPLGYVVESLQPAAVDVKEISGQGRVVKVRGEYLPLIPLYQMFGITPAFTDPSEGIVVILESDGKKAALFVDDLVGQQQVVVKNLESNYRKVAGISGATILGDGGVSLIIDVAALLRSSRQLSDASVYS